MPRAYGPLFRASTPIVEHHAHSETERSRCNGAAASNAEIFAQHFVPAVAVTLAR